MNIFNIFKQVQKNQNKLYFNLKSSFSSVTSSFKSKSKLTEFYKYVHPDILGNAPEKVREENLRSLKTLNMYLDALSQNQGVQDHQLNFYCAEKSNNKSKKYYYFQVRLNALRPNSPEDQIKKHMDIQIQSLILGLKSTQEQINPYFKKAADKERDLLRQSQLKDQQQQRMQQMDPKQSFKQNFQSEITGIEKEKSQLDIFKEKFNQKITQQQLFKNVMSYRNSKLKDAIQNELYYMDTPQNKPVMWSKIIMNDSQYLKDIHNVFQKLIDPRLIFLDEKLTEEQIEIFRFNFVNTTQDPELFITKLKILQNVFGDMENQNPQIPLYVTNKYGWEDVPGFFSIPYEFDCEELEDIYSKLRDRIISARQYFDETTIKFLKDQEKIKQKFQFKSVQILNSNQEDQNNKIKDLKFKNTIDVLDNNVILVKQANKLLTDLTQNNGQIIQQLFNQQTLVLGSKEINISKFEIQLPLNFNQKIAYQQILDYIKQNQLF